jgi:hypothetical protein
VVSAWPSLSPVHLTRFQGVFMGGHGMSYPGAILRSILRLIVLVLVVFATVVTLLGPTRLRR